MKRLLPIILFFFISENFAQDTLYLPVPMLGSEKYILYDDGTFIFSSHLCGFTFVSYGDYKKNLFGYNFKYDTTRCPNPSIVEVKNVALSDSIILSFFDLVDSSSQPFFGRLMIGNQQFNCYTDSMDSLVISKRNFKSNTLIMQQLEKELTFTFDTTCSKLKIYLNPIGFGYDCGINDVKKLKKTRHGYLDKFKVFDEIPEKSWKKGKKRVVRNYFQMIE